MKAIGNGTVRRILGSSVVAMSSALTLMPLTSGAAIIGSGSPQAIIGSGAPQAIIGSGSPQAIIGSGAPQASIGSGSPFALLAFGAVTQQADGSVSILGQRVFLTEATRFHRGNANALKAGRVAAVFGIASADGIFASDVYLIPGQFVEGTTTAYVAGYVTEGSSSSGFFKIGDLAVYPDSAGTNPLVWTLDTGTFVQVEGVLIGGRLHAASIVVD